MFSKNGVELLRNKFVHKRYLKGNLHPKGLLSLAMAMDLYTPHLRSISLYRRDCTRFDKY